jgi:hypothetical protein
MRTLGSTTGPWLLLLVALSGCPTVELGDAPADIGLCNPAGGLPYFQDVIWPEFIRPSNTTTGCTIGGCHGAGGTSPRFTTSPVDFAFNYRLTQSLLNCGTPMASRLLTKPLAGVEGHSGKDIFQPTDPAVQVFLDWFE